MFYGEYNHNVDRKGRLVLPARFREICKDSGIERFFITRGLDKCLFMFSEEEWKAQEKKLKTLSFTKQEPRHFNRLFFSGAAEIIPDKQGRFVVPQFLKTYANIKKDVILLGISNRIEIWDRQTWEDSYSQCSGSYEQIAENMIDG